MYLPRRPPGVPLEVPDIVLNVGIVCRTQSTPPPPTEKMVNKSGTAERETWYQHSRAWGQGSHQLSIGSERHRIPSLRHDRLCLWQGLYSNDLIEYICRVGKHHAPTKLQQSCAATFHRRQHVQSGHWCFYPTNTVAESIEPFSEAPYPLESPTKAAVTRTTHKKHDSQHERLMGTSILNHKHSPLSKACLWTMPPCRAS